LAYEVYPHSFAALRGAIKDGHGRMGHQVDQPVAGLLKDL